MQVFFYFHIIFIIILQPYFSSIKLNTIIFVFTELVYGVKILN